MVFNELFDLKLVKVFRSSENLFHVIGTHINYSLLVLARGPTSVSVESGVGDRPANEWISTG